jgi:hypothetical protein
MVNNPGYLGDVILSRSLAEAKNLLRKGDNNA